MTGGFDETYRKATHGGEKHFGSQLVHDLHAVIKKSNNRLACNQRMEEGFSNQNHSRSWPVLIPCCHGQRSPLMHGGTLLSCADVTWKSLCSWSSPGSRPMQGGEGTDCCCTSCPTRDWMENIDFLSEEAHSETHLLRAFFSLEANGMQRQSPFPCHVEGSRHGAGR